MKSKPFFVIDTNILISAFLLTETSNAALTLKKARDTGKIIMSEESFTELFDVLVRPKFDKYISLDKRLQLLADLKSIIKTVTVETKITVCRDPKDNKFLELAIAGNASCIVTGDNDLLVLNPFNKIPILTPADFLRS